MSSDDVESDGAYEFDLRPGELPEGVKKDLLKEGEGWRKPKRGDEVKVHCVGTLQAMVSCLPPRERAASLMCLLLARSRS